MTKHNNSKIILLALSILFSAIFMLMNFHSKAYAATYSSASLLDSKLINAQQTAQSFDSNCNSNLSTDHSIGGSTTTRDMINGVSPYSPVDYQYLQWISPSGNDGTSTVNETVVSGQSAPPINLNLNMSVFLCFTMVQLPGPTNNTTQGTNDNLSLRVCSPSLNSSNCTPFTADQPPNTSSASSIYYPALSDQIMYYQAAQAPAGWSTNLGSGFMTTSADSNSRYWFNSSGFTLTPPANLTQGSYSITIGVPYQLINLYYGGTSVQCKNSQGVEVYLGSLGQLSTSSFSPCETFMNYFTVNINVISGASSFTFVSGNIYEHQTNGTNIGLANVPVQSCLSYEPAYNPSGQGMVGLAMTPTGDGYWQTSPNGYVYSFGDAGYYGSMGGVSLNAPIVGIVATPDGKGYWLVGADGGIFNFGDAGFYGSMGGKALNAPVVGMAATPDGKGYWLVGADGGIFTFGDAGFYGSMGGKALNAPVVGMAATPSGKGYWLVGADGGIFNFGDAGFYGSFTNSSDNSSKIVSIARTVTGNGYYVLHNNGYIDGAGDAFIFYTNSSGQYTFPIAESTSLTNEYGYCVRPVLSPNPPAGYIGPILNGSYQCYPTWKTYEWQVSVIYDPTIRSGCSYPPDMNTDQNLDFEYVPAVTVSCGSVSATTGSGADPLAVGKTFALTISYPASGGNGSNMTISLGSTPNINALPSSGVATYDSSNGTYTYTTGQILSISRGAVYTINYSISGGGMAGSIPCSSTIYAGYQPYVSVLGGDIAAGPGYMSPNGSCSVNQSSIMAYNNGLNSSGNSYIGSGTQNAALAQGSVYGFLSAINPPNGSSSMYPNSTNNGGYVLSFTSPSPNPPSPNSINNLTLSNQTNVNGEYYGGDLGLSGSWACLPDYYDNTTALTPLTTSAGVASLPTTSGSYTYTGNLTLNGGTVTSGNQITIKVKGNVYIDSNISYASYSSISQIPQFKLIVNGSIYVAPQVSLLEGVYIAQGSSGAFYTCGQDTFDTFQAIVNNYAACNHPFEVIGSVSATKIVLGRTYGNPVKDNSNQVSNNPAETFQYSPEVWMAPSTLPKTPYYDYVTSLPPVL